MKERTRETNETMDYKRISNYQRTGSGHATSRTAGWKKNWTTWSQKIIKFQDNFGMECEEMERKNE